MEQSDLTQYVWNGKSWVIQDFNRKQLDIRIINRLLNEDDSLIEYIKSKYPEKFV